MGTKNSIIIFGAIIFTRVAAAMMFLSPNLLLRTSFENILVTFHPEDTFSWSQADQGICHCICRMSNSYHSC